MTQKIEEALDSFASNLADNILNHLDRLPAAASAEERKEMVESIIYNTAYAAVTRGATS